MASYNVIQFLNPLIKKSLLYNDLNLKNRLEQSLCLLYKLYNEGCSLNDVIVVKTITQSDIFYYFFSLSPLTDTHKFTQFILAMNA